MHAVHIYPLDSKHITQTNKVRTAKADFLNICGCPDTSAYFLSRKTEQELGAGEQQWLQQSQQNPVTLLD